MSARLNSLLKSFSGKRILVIGDIMLDKYIWGEVSRISPEAPVQVVEVASESYAAGGAANVARNAASLGGSVRMCGITGDDDARRILVGELRKDGIDTGSVYIEEDKPTTLKVRIMGRSQQLLRVDYEKKAHVHPEIEKKMLLDLGKHIRDADAVIVSDYAKGVITEKVCRFLISEAKKTGKIVVIDPKPRNKAFYKGATLITPNHAEACLMANAEVDNDDGIGGIGTRLSLEMDANILITRGEKGMSLFEKGKQIAAIPTQAKEVYDVTGAGDTVVATIALALSAGSSMQEAALMANHAAGIKVGKIGTSTITKEELEESIAHG